MKLDVPVMFNAEVVHKGKRLAKPEAQTEWIEVEVREVSDFDAPLATEWTREDSSPACTRWFEETHWVPYEYKDEDGGRHRLDAEGLRERLRTGRKSQNPLSVGTEHVLQDFAAGNRPAFDPASFRSIESSDRDAVRSAAMKNASNAIIVDGGLYKRGSEPVYRLTRSRIASAGGRHSLRPEVALVSEGGDPKDMFRANRWDDMAEEAGERYNRQVELDETARITVYIPESIRFDDERAALFTGLEGILSSQRRFLQTARLSDMRTWLELAEALAAAKENWTDETAAALETAADTYLAVTLAADDYYSGTLKAVMNRWRMRPLGDDFDGSSVLKPY